MDLRDSPKLIPLTFTCNHRFLQTTTITLRDIRLRLFSDKKNLSHNHSQTKKHSQSFFDKKAFHDWRTLLLQTLTDKNYLLADFTDKKILTQMSSNKKNFSRRHSDSKTI